MLPGLKFLLLATTMSVSVLVFALGAAALLRATHENFATLPQRRPPQEQVFVKQQYDTNRPVIALLRVEPEPTKADTATVPVIASPSPETPTAAAEAKTQPAREIQVAAAATEAQPSLPRAVALPDIPELPMPPMPDVASLQSEFMRDTEKKDVAIAAAPAIETTPVAASDQKQTTAISESAKSEAAPAQRLAALSDGGTETEKLAAEARKKAEASATRIRNQQAAKRARAAKIAAQRRAAATRARAAQQKQQTQPFGSPFGTN